MNHDMLLLLFLEIRYSLEFEVAMPIAYPVSTFDALLKRAVKIIYPCTDISSDVWCVLAHHDSS